MGFRIPLLAALGALALGCSGASPNRTTPVAGTQGHAPSSATELPSVPILGKNRRPIQLGEVVRGKPALINLWATWCEACEKEFDALNRLHERVADRARVVGIAVGEPHDAVVTFAERRGLRYAQLVDEDFAFADALGSHQVPTTLVVDRHGSVRFRGGDLDVAALAAFSRTLTE